MTTVTMRLLLVVLSSVAFLAAVVQAQIQFGGNRNDIIFDEDTPVGTDPACVTSDQRQGFCQPLAQCALFYAEIATLLDTVCDIGNGQQGVCCPVKSPSQTSQKSAIISRPTPPAVQIPQVSMEQLQESVDAGLERFQTRERNINKIIFVDKIQVPQNSPAASHQRFFTTTNSILDEGNKAQLNIESSLNLVDNFRLSRLQGTFALPHISIKNTKIGNTCPSTSRCNPNYPYRTLDGSCNNQINTDFNKAGTSFQRILQPKYADGVNSQREFSTATGQPLPSSRFVSSRFISDRNNPYGNLTLMVMQWGQFLDHDLTHTPISKGPNQTFISCCNNGQFLASNLVHPDCFPIHIPPTDNFFQRFNQQCMEFVRSLPAPRRECSLGPREQLNQITGWLDASNVYGSTENKGNSLREFTNGRLSIQRTNIKGLLPANPSECSQQQRSCFRAGDSRVNEQIDLAIIHTIFVREHNRIATILLQLNPNWNDEILYQETRRIIIAIIQHITYNEFLPLILGPEFMKSFKLHPNTNGYTNLYNNNIDPSVTNAFATAAYRFGHTLVQGKIQGFNRFGSLTDDLPLEKTQFTPFPIYDNVDNFVRGLVNQQCQQFDNFVTEALTNHLFQGGSNFGLDLMALNIQRGRDHGIPPYNDWREVCGLPKITSWEELALVMTPEAAASLRSIYNSVDDIDLFVGGLGEKPLPNAMLSPVFVCIVGDMFARLKLGDRFFYEERTARFTEGQLNQIRKVSLARVFCDNSDDIDVIQPLVFQQASLINKRQPCNSNAIPGIDFNFWRESRRTNPQQQAQPQQQQRPSAPLQQQGQQQGQRPFQNNNQGRPFQNQQSQVQRPFQQQQFQGQGRPQQGRPPFQNQRRFING